LSAFQGGNLTAPYAAQYANAQATNQQAATSENQQAGQLLANAGGGNVQGAQASEYQQITNQQALANQTALTNAFMGELNASLGLTQEGGGFVQSGIQQEIQSNTQLQGQLSQLMAALASAYVKSSGSSGGGSGSGVNSLISGAKSAYNNVSNLLNGGNSADAEAGLQDAESGAEAQAQLSSEAESGLANYSAGDTSGILSDLSSTGSGVELGDAASAASDASDLSDIGSFSSGADAAGAASDTAALADLQSTGSAVTLGTDAGASAGAGAGADAGLAGVAGEAAGPLALAGIYYGAFEQAQQDKVPNIDETISGDVGQAEQGIPAADYQKAIQTGQSPFQVYMQSDPTGANADIASLMQALESPLNQQAAAQFGTQLPENFTGVNGIPNQLLNIYGGGPGGGSVVGDQLYHLT